MDFRFPIIRSREVLRSYLVGRRLRFVVLFQLRFTASDVFIDLAQFRFSGKKRVPLRVIRAPLRSRYFTGVEQFRRDVHLVRFMSNDVRDVICHFASVLGIGFAIVRRPTFLFLIARVKANYRFSEVTPRDFLRAHAMVGFFFLYVGPFVRGGINGISRRRETYVLGQLGTKGGVIYQVVPMITRAFNGKASIGRMVQFRGSG